METEYRDGAGSGVGAGSWRRDRVFRIILIVSALIKLGLAVHFGSLRLRGDEMDYIHTARVLVVENRVFDMYRPPAYPFLQAAVIFLGAGNTAIRILQVIFSVLTTVFVYRMTGSAYGRTAARFASAIFAFDPVLVEFSYILLSETLFVFLVAALFDGMVSAKRTASNLHWLGLGAIFGLAVLTRSQIMTFFPFIWFWVFMEWKGSIRISVRRLLFFSFGSALLISPWTIRNYRASGAFVPVDVVGPMNLLMSTHPDTLYVDKGTTWKESWTGVDGVRYRLAARRDTARAMRRAMEISLARIRRNPGGFFRKCIWEAGHLWTLDNHLLVHLRNGWYGSEARIWLLPPAAVFTALFTVCLTVSGAAGICFVRDGPISRLAILAFLHAMLLFGLVFSTSRYAVPLRPFLAIAAGGWWAAKISPGGDSPVPIWNRTRILVFSAIAMCLLAIWSRDMPLIRDMLIRNAEGLTAPELIIFR
ncbi:glycosyltransferase family 39 protein [bacterium]|nr:glycosyltransferase family 39 protein [candidate division CSSED10-310 bacterium]